MAVHVLRMKRELNCMQVAYGESKHRKTPRIFHPLNQGKDKKKSHSKP
jgi:hypothetical protein